jgi:hypothetical protein
MIADGREQQQIKAARCRLRWSDARRSDKIKAANRGACDNAPTGLTTTTTDGIVMAILTLSQALDRAKAGEPINAPAPDSKRQAQVRASMGMAVNVLARQAALKEAKHQLSARGFRPTQFSHRDLVIRAEAYLAEHREELAAEAREIVERWQAAGVFGKRGGIHFTRRAKLRNNDQPKAR